MGNVTAVKHRDGSTILKGKIFEMTNPNTPAQQSQRSKFSTIQLLLVALLPIIKMTFQPLKAVHSAYNSAMSIALKAFAAAPGNGMYLAHSSIQFSNGPVAHANLEVDHASTADLTTGFASVKVDWDDNSVQPNAESSDKLFIVINYREAGYAEIIDTGVTRAAGTCTFTGMSNVQGQAFWGYTFKNVTTGKYSSASFIAGLEPDKNSYPMT